MLKKITSLSLAFFSVFLIPAVSLTLVYGYSLDKYREQLHSNMLALAGISASVVDVDLHDSIREIGAISSPEYRQAILPLLNIHRSNKDIYYLYTMIVEDDRSYFILDTANFVDELDTPHPLKASAIMEYYQADEVDGPIHRRELLAGRSHLSPPYEDEFGRFVTAYAPFFYDDGRVAGYIGMDVSQDQYYTWLDGLSIIYTVGLFMSALLSAAVGYFFWKKRNDLMEVNRIVEKMSVTDKLTGLRNRRYFDQEFEKLLSYGARGDHKISLIMADIDHFKTYNDSFGHQAGDTCLKQVAKIFKEVFCRKGDILARYGGEEFVMLVPGVDRDGAAALCARILDRFKAANIPHHHSVEPNYVSVSLGVVTFTGQEILPPRELLETVDKLLYLSKTRGRNRYSAEALV